MICLASRATLAADCNGNRIDDDVETAPDHSAFAQIGHSDFTTDLWTASDRDYIWLPPLIADLTGDGKLDALALINRDALRFGLFAGAGNGRFHAPLPVLPPGAAERLASGEQSCTVADLDGDHDLDAAFVVDSAIAILKNDGAGAFTTLATIPISSRPLAIVSGDLNGDGAIDLVTGNADIAVASNASVLLNRGGGTFSEPRNFAVGLGIQQMVLGNVDLDESMELLVIHGNGPGKITVFDAMSQGSLVVEAESVLPAEFNLLGVADLDLDHDVDVLGAKQRGGTYLLQSLLQDSDGRFTESSAGEVNVNFSARHLADVDSDGDVDLCILSQDNQRCRTMLQAWENDGRAAFRAGAPASAESGFLSSGDVDQDGRLDVIIAQNVEISTYSVRRVGPTPDCNSNGVPDSCERDCNGNFLPDSCDVAIGFSPDCDGDGWLDACELDCDDDSIPDECAVASGEPDCNANGFPDSCEPLDRNRNGVPDDCDIRAGTSADCNSNQIPDDFEIAEIWSLGAERRYPGDASKDDPWLEWRLSPGDIDGDGDLDVLAENYWEMRIAWTMGDGSFAVQPMLRINTGRACLGDFDSDRDMDLAISESRATSCGGEVEEQILTYLNHGMGVFRLDHISRAGPQSDQLFVFDATDDGRLDIVKATQAGIWLLPGQGDGTFASPLTAFRLPESSFGELTAADVNGDGALDFVTTTGFTLLNRGGGMLDRVGDFVVDLPTFQRLIVGDLDGDGDVDILQGSLYLNNGKGVFLQAPGFRVPYRDGAAADMDGDQDLDLILFQSEFRESRDATRLELWRNQGRASFELRQSVQIVGTYVVPLLALDANSDGRPDVVTSYEGLRVYLNDGDGAILAPGSRDIVRGQELHSLGAADMDADGDMDLCLLESGAPMLVRRLANGRMTSEILQVPPTLHWLVASDLDGNRQADLIGGDDVGTRIFWADAGEKFDEVTTFALRTGGLLPLDGDLDGDVDLLAPCEGKLLVNEGARQFIERSALAPAADCGSSFTLSVDLDRDGDVDLIAAPARVFLNDGRGSWSSRDGATLVGEASSGAAGDFNGDAIPDLVVSEKVCTACLDDEDDCACSAFLTTFDSDGKGGLVESSRVELPYNSDALEARDLDLDGDIDLLVAFTRISYHFGERAGNKVGVFLNDGAGHWTLWDALDVAHHPYEVAAIESTGDGQPEIFVLSYEGRDFNPDDEDEHPREIFSRPTLALFHATRATTGLDQNHNGLLDTCEAVQYRRGDWNQDGAFNLADAIALLGHLFLGAQAFSCEDAADVNDSGSLDITDAIAILSHLFLGGAPPREPFAQCGGDPTDDGLACSNFGSCG